MNYKQLLIAILILLNINTIAQQKFNKQNFAEMYNTNGVDLHPKFEVYHHNDSVSTLFYEFDNGELKYNMTTDSTYYSKAVIHYELYYNYKAKQLIDSGSFVYTDTKNTLNNSSIGYIEIPIKAGNIYLLYIKFTDINRDYNVRTIIDIDKNNKNTRQNYYIKAEDELPLMKNYINRDENFALISDRFADSNITLRFFRPNTSIPKPPMIESNNRTQGVRADTFYQIPFYNGSSDILQLSDQGFYHFYNADNPKEGFTIYRFTANYPYITTAMQMIMPLRYISTGSEFKELYKAKDRKKAVEDFWIKMSGDKERAQNMIKLFYNRVQNANINFTADREGWMTDRGMIFIIYGAPDVVYRDGMMETWQYGNFRNDKAITFNFFKVKNPFTDNYYVMQRDADYKFSWIKGIEVWRK